MSVLTVEQPAERVHELAHDRTEARSTGWLTAAVEALRDFRTTS